MRWHQAESRQYVFSDEGYVVTKTWTGQDWVYMAWGPCTPIPGTQLWKPSLLNPACASSETAKRVCETHRGAGA